MHFLESLHLKGSSALRVLAPLLHPSDSSGPIAGHVAIVPPKPLPNMYKYIESASLLLCQIVLWGTCLSDQKDDECKKFVSTNFLFVPRACLGSLNLGLGKQRGDPRLQQNFKNDLTRSPSKT